MDNTAFRLRSAREPFSLLNLHVQLKDSGAAALIEGGPELWAAFAQKPELQSGRLLGSYAFERDMPHWEMHPAGDELLVLLSGAAEVVLQDGRTDRAIELGAGQAFLVPFGVWHRLRVKTPGEILFVTPAKGNQHRML